MELEGKGMGGEQGAEHPAFLLSNNVISFESKSQKLKPRTVNLIFS